MNEKYNGAMYIVHLLVLWSGAVMASSGRGSWWQGLFVHSVLGIGASVAVGFLPEALLSRLYYNTGLEAFFPAIGISAVIMGGLIGPRLLQGRGAAFVWIIGSAFLLQNAYDLGRAWDPRWHIEKTKWAYVIANLFGRTSECSASECLYELFGTMPFVTSIGYSIGAVVGKFWKRRANSVPAPEG